MAVLDVVGVGFVVASKGSDFIRYFGLDTRFGFRE